MNAAHHTPRITATLMEVLYPHGYTPPPADPLDALPKLHIAPMSVLDQDLDEASAYVSALSIRGRRTVSKTGCEHEDSTSYQDAMASTFFSGIEAAQCLLKSEPIVAALVLEIYWRADRRNLAPAHLRAQVEMQLSAIASARKLQHLVPREDQVRLLAMRQAELLN